MPQVGISHGGRTRTVVPESKGSAELNSCLQSVHCRLAAWHIQALCAGRDITCICNIIRVWISVLHGYALPGLGDQHTLACNILTDLNSGRMKTDRSHFTVMAYRMMLGGVVAEVVCAFAPENFKMALLDSILDPTKSHVDGFRSALFDGFVGDSDGGRVVNLNGRWRLLVAEFFEHVSDGLGVSAVILVAR